MCIQNGDPIAAKLSSGPQRYRLQGKENTRANSENITKPPGTGAVAVDYYFNKLSLSPDYKLNQTRNYALN